MKIKIMTMLILVVFSVSSMCQIPVISVGSSQTSGGSQVQGGNNGGAVKSDGINKRKRAKKKFKNLKRKRQKAKKAKKPKKPSEETVEGKTRKMRGVLRKRGTEILDRKLIEINRHFNHRSFTVPHPDLTHEAIDHYSKTYKADKFLNSGTYGYRSSSNARSQHLQEKLLVKVNPNTATFNDLLDALKNKKVIHTWKTFKSVSEDVGLEIDGPFNPKLITKMPDTYKELDQSTFYKIKTKWNKLPKWEKIAGAIGAGILIVGAAYAGVASIAAVAGEESLMAGLEMVGVNTSQEIVIGEVSMVPAEESLPTLAVGAAGTTESAPGAIAITGIGASGEASVEAAGEAVLDATEVGRPIAGAIEMGDDAQAVVVVQVMGEEDTALATTPIAHLVMDAQVYLATSGIDADGTVFATAWLVE